MWLKGEWKKRRGKNPRQRSSDAENCPGALQGADLAFTSDQSSLLHSCKYYLASINTGRGHREVPTMFDYCRNDGKFSKLFVSPVNAKKEKNPVCHMLALSLNVAQLGVGAESFSCENMHRASNMF